MSRLLLCAWIVAAMALAGTCAAQDGRDIGVYRRDQLPKGGPRLAVVVGIDAYESLPSLRCAERDAEDTARELTSLGFEVMRMLPSGRDGSGPRRGATT